jgi:hypothetical protein
VTESEEENCNCVKSLHGSSELMLCWTMWVSEGFNITATRKTQTVWEV